MTSDLRELRDLADSLLEEDAILPIDALVRTWWHRAGGPQGGRLSDALAFVESHKTDIGRYLRAVRQTVVPVTQFAVAAGFEQVAAMTSDDDLKRCVPGHGKSQSTAGWMAITEANHSVLVASLLRKIEVKNGQERAIGEQLVPAAQTGVLPTSQVGRILAASRSQMPARRLLLLDGEQA